jgi:AcrR family transcriptional regulator
MTRKTTPKSEETRARILEAALTTFRERGFERATMREIAQAAQVATGAAYYYFDSKEAIVMAFYRRAQEELRTEVERALVTSRTFEARVRAIVTGKLTYFGPNRALLGALSAHADPGHPLSPFSEATRAVREEDTAGFARAVEDSYLRLPKQIAPYLPRLLWLYQMGIILFWVYDGSSGQRRTDILLEKTLKMMAMTLKLAALPFLRPMHRLAGELLEAVYGKA